MQGNAGWCVEEYPLYVCIILERVLGKSRHFTSAIIHTYPMLIWFLEKYNSSECAVIKITEEKHLLKPSSLSTTNKTDTLCSSSRGTCTSGGTWEDRKIRKLVTKKAEKNKHLVSYKQRINDWNKKLNVRINKWKIVLSNYEIRDVLKSAVQSNRWTWLFALMFPCLHQLNL